MSQYELAESPELRRYKAKIAAKLAVESIGLAARKIDRFFLIRPIAPEATRKSFLEITDPSPSTEKLSEEVRSMFASLGLFINEALKPGLELTVVGTGSNPAEFTLPEAKDGKIDIPKDSLLVVIGDRMQNPREKLWMLLNPSEGQLQFGHPTLSCLGDPAFNFMRTFVGPLMQEDPANTIARAKFANQLARDLTRIFPSFPA